MANWISKNSCTGKCSVDFAVLLWCECWNTDGSVGASVDVVLDTGVVAKEISDVVIVNLQHRHLHFMCTWLFLRYQPVRIILIEIFYTMFCLSHVLYGGYKSRSNAFLYYTNVLKSGNPKYNNSTLYL